MKDNVWNHLDLKNTGEKQELEEQKQDQVQQKLEKDKQIEHEEEEPEETVEDPKAPLKRQNQHLHKLKT